VPDQPSSTAFTYDAFISYRHSSPDDKIAENLHRALEEYVVPGSLVKKGFPKRLTRVFRDREELPTSNSLTDGIRDALQQSRFMIVVCSRRTPSSKWIAKEIEIFKSLGRGRQILALLIEGEPEESFPPLLREARKITAAHDGTATEEVEEISPLAADIRAASLPESLRLLRDEKLRLLAPLLGCSFDDLKQRHRQRFLRRVKIASAATLLAIVAAATAGYGYWDTHYHVHAEYYANFTKRWGQVKGIGRLTPDQVSHRQNSGKFYVRGNRVVAADVVNGYGLMTVNNMVDTFIGEPDTSNDATRDFHYEWEYSTDGRVTKEIAFDRAHRVVWSFDYGSQTIDIGHYADKYGYPRPRIGSGADYVQFTRNSDGYETLMHFTDSKGELEPDQDGVFGLRIVKDAIGLDLEVSNLDANDQLMLNRYGYARLTRKFDSLGNATESHFFGVDGKPHATKSGVGRMTASYDQYGRLTLLQYWTTDEKPTVLGDGYSQVSYAYDDHGDEIEKVFRDPSSKPIAKPGDFARLTHAYDNQGRMIRASYFGADGKPVKIEDGYSQVAYEYDSHGYQKSETLLDGDGKQVANKSGVARMTWTHDDQGNENELSLFGVDGKPVLGSDRYATLRMKYDSHSNRIEQSYFGVQGEPIISKGGYAKMRMKYDDRGSETEESYLDLNDRPVVSSSGWAKVTMARNDRGLVTEHKFYGANGSPVMIPDGFAKIDRTYDDRGNQTDAICFDVNGKRIRNKKGYNRVTRTYNQFDQIVEEMYRGVSDEPVMTKEGFSRRLYSYDEHGNKTSVEKFDTAGKSLGKEPAPSN